MARPPKAPSVQRSLTFGAGRSSALERRYYELQAPWITIGTDGVDGVDALLAANPHPYATGDTPGPDPFENGWTNGFDLLPSGDTAGPLQYRYHPVFGLELRGEPKGGADLSIIAHLTDLPTLDFPIGPLPVVSVDTTAVLSFFVDLAGNLTMGTSGI